MGDTQPWLAVGAVAGSVVTALAGGAAVLLNALLKSRREEQVWRASEQGIILDRQEKQIARLESQAVEQQQVIAHIHDLHADCRAESAQLRLYLSMLFDYARRQYAALGKAGITTDPPPELPDVLRAHDDADFVTKTTAQNTALLAEVDAKLREGAHENPDRRG